MRTLNIPVNKNLSATPLTSSWQGLNETVILNPNGPVSFQWTDFHETCQLNQARLKNDVVFKAEFEQKTHELQKLRGMPVWLRTPNSQIIQTNLYELYQDAIFERHWCGQESHAPCEVSFISPSGPYKKFAVVDCLNSHTYQDFVQCFLLEGKLPQRDFRLRVPGRLLMEFGPGLSGAGLIDLQQITSTGLLFKCPAPLFFNEVRPHGKLRLLIKSSSLDGANISSNWEGFQQAIGEWGLNPFYTQNKLEAFMLSCTDFQVASRFDFGQTQDVYLFVDYKALESSHQLMAQHFARFVKTGRSHMKQFLLSKSA
jgi:hypothetical protein